MGSAGTYPEEGLALYSGWLSRCQQKLFFKIIIAYRKNKKVIWSHNTVNAYHGISFVKYVKFVWQRGTVLKNILVLIFFYLQTGWGLSWLSHVEFHNQAHFGCRISGQRPVTNTTLVIICLKFSVRYLSIIGKWEWEGAKSALHITVISAIM